MKDDGTKALKGNDRAGLKKLQASIDSAVGVSLLLCLHTECAPFIESLGRSIANRSPTTIVSANLLADEACILHLRDVGKHSNLVKKAVDCFNSLSQVLEKINKGLRGDLSTSDSQKCFEEWMKWCSAMHPIIEETSALCDKRPSDLVEVITHTSITLKDFLCGKVHTEAFDLAVKCIAFVAKHVVPLACSKTPLEPDPVAVFNKNMNDCARLSTVITDKGASIRDGLKVLQVLVQGHYCAVKAGNGENEEEERSEAEVKAVGEVHAALRALGEWRLKPTLEAFLQALEGPSQGEGTETMNKETSEVFLKEAEAFGQSLRQFTGVFLADLQQSFKEELDDITGQWPDLSLPTECIVCEDLETLHTTLDFVQSIVKNKELNTKVVTTSTSLEQLKAKVEQHAAHLGMQADELFADLKTVDLKWKECLAWLCLVCSSH